MTEVSEDTKSKARDLITKLSTDAEFAQRFTDDSLATVAAEGIPESALPYLASELDKHFADPDVVGHGWVYSNGKRKWVWQSWSRGF